MIFTILKHDSLYLVLNCSGDDNNMSILQSCELKRYQTRKGKSSDRTVAYVLFLYNKFRVVPLVLIALFSKILDMVEILKPLTCCASLVLAASKLRPLLSERDDTAFFIK